MVRVERIEDKDTLKVKAFNEKVEGSIPSCGTKGFNMNWRNLPNPSEPADSQRRIEAVLRVYKHIENTKELSEEDKAEFLHCIYIYIYVCL